MSDRHIHFYGRTALMLSAMNRRRVAQEELRMASPKISEEEEKKIIGYLTSYMSANDITQDELARRANIPSSVFSNMISEQYCGDRQKYLVSAKQFLQREEERCSAPSLNQFVETTAAKQIIMCCRQNHVHGTIGTVIGESGKGKTFGFQEYARKNSNVIVVSASSWTRTAGQLAREIGAKIMSRKGTVSMTRQEYCRRLVERIRGRSILLIIDQAHQLQEDAFEFIQNLWDQANSGESSRFGIVMGGTARLANDLASDRYGYLFEQLTSRINAGFTVRLNKPFTLNDIKAIFDSDRVTYKPHPATLHELLRIANSNKDGSLRSAVAVFLKAQEVAQRTNQDKDTAITTETIDTMRTFMLVPPKKLQDRAVA